MFFFRFPWNTTVPSVPSDQKYSTKPEICALVASNLVLLGGVAYLLTDHHETTISDEGPDWNAIGKMFLGVFVKLKSKDRKSPEISNDGVLEVQQNLLKHVVFFAKRNNE